MFAAGPDGIREFFMHYRTFVGVWRVGHGAFCGVQNGNPGPPDAKLHKNKHCHTRILRKIGTCHYGLQGDIWRFCRTAGSPSLADVTMGASIHGGIKIQRWREDYPCRICFDSSKST